jgi:hypothetical protein
MSTAASSAVQRQPFQDAAALSPMPAEAADAGNHASSFPMNSLPSDLLLQVLLPVGSAELLRVSQVPGCLR